MDGGAVCESIKMLGVGWSVQTPGTCHRILLRCLPVAVGVCGEYDKAGRETSFDIRQQAVSTQRYSFFLFFVSIFLFFVVFFWFVWLFFFLCLLFFLTQVVLNKFFS